MKGSDSFRAAWWLRNPHLQTIWGRAARSRTAVPLRREIVETPDRDELVLDHADVTGARARVILLHGLEGSSNSVYIQGTIRELARRGVSATVMNFRSCARDPAAGVVWTPNRASRLYHSGETSDLDFVVRLMKERSPAEELRLLGVSLGGNVVLKWLGEHPHEQLVRRAATISVPYDLGAGARHLERGLGRIYVRLFLRTLSMKAEHVAQRFPELHSEVDFARGRAASTFYEYDDAVTGPLHGFGGADDYYSRSSSIHFIGRITVPTLCISAADDPFLPAAVLDEARKRASPMVELVVTKKGGHVGFVGGKVPWRADYWAEERVAEWLSQENGSR